VSELHGEVSRQMWQSLYPNTPVEKVPIGYITNGIHLLGWMKGSGAAVLAEKIDQRRR
jgi:starch phosphorylase